MTFVNRYWVLAAIGIAGAAALVARSPGEPTSAKLTASLRRDFTEDCNSNGIVDEVEINTGSGYDCNGNWRLDDCDLREPPRQLLTYPQQGVNEQFGTSLAFSGNRVAIGALQHRVAIFEWDGAGWSAQASIVPLPLFMCTASALALQGDVVAYSAATYFHTRGGSCGVGQVMIARYDGTGWTEEARFANPETPLTSGSAYGFSLALQGDRLFVSNRTNPYGAGVKVEGGAHIYRYNGSAWMFEQRIEVVDGELDHRYYVAEMAVDGDLVVLGTWASVAPYVCGPIYVLRQHALKNGATRWLQEAKIELPEGVCDDEIAINVANDTLLIGARSGLDLDSIFIYRQQRVEGSAAALWELEATLAGQLPMAMHNATVAVKSEDALQTDPLSVSLNLYRRQGADEPSWSLDRRIAVPLNPSGSMTVALQGSALLVGQIFSSVHGSWSGAVYAYQLVEDCNSNGVPDQCDVDTRSGTDCNSNGLLDECEHQCSATGFAIKDGARFANMFEECQTAPCLDPLCSPPLYSDACCTLLDNNADGDVDLSDFAAQQRCTRPAIALDCNTNAIADYLETVPADFDGDGVATPQDFPFFHDCLSPTCDFESCNPVNYGDACCLIADADADGDVDLVDFAAFQAGTTAE